MNNELIFRIALFVLLAGFVLHRGLTTRRNSPSPDSIVIERDESGTASRLSALLSLVALASSAIYIFYPNWVAWVGFSLPTWVRWAGIPIALIGFVLIEAAQKALGSNWSDTPVFTKEQTLSTNGPYRSIRHPIYTAFLLILSAPLLLSANWLLGLAWIIGTYVDVSSRSRYEEGLLLEQFGDDYAAYLTTSGRFLPKF
jgi:protein-S-isoprenylcysteine O-methyltransferase Ste14